MMEQTITHSSG